MANPDSGRVRGPNVTVLAAWPKTGRDGKTAGGRPIEASADTQKNKGERKGD